MPREEPRDDDRWRADLRLGAASRRAAAQCAGQGLKLPVKPRGDMPDLPADVTELGDSELMTLFGELDRWIDYINTQLGAAEADEDHAAARLERYKALSVLKNSDAKTVTAAKARALTDERYTELDAAYAEARAYRKLVVKFFEGADRREKIVSRELSRRIGRADVDRRNTRWNP